MPYDLSVGLTASNENHSTASLQISAKSGPPYTSLFQYSGLQIYCGFIPAFMRHKALSNSEQ